MKLRSGLLIAFAIAIIFYSCRNKGDKNIDQGEIHYSIEYMGNVSMMPREVLPRNLIVSFKKDKILFDISAPFGNSGISNLSNPEKGIFDTYIRLLAWKYYYSAKEGEMHPGFEEMEGIEIKKTSRTSVICGFDCKSADVTLPYDRSRIYEIWYTNEINIKKPNIANPFSEIDGVLMKFFFKMGPAEMHFEAETVYEKDISDKLFDRREKYLRVSREEIDKFITRMISM